MRKSNIVRAFVAFAIVVLEILPHGAVLNFGEPTSDGSIGFIHKTYSYFSLTPFGYANFGPFLTAILSCVLLCLLVISILIEKDALQNTSYIVSIFALFTSLMPLLLGVRNYSVCGLAISLLLAVEIIICLSKRRKRRNYTN